MVVVVKTVKHNNIGLKEGVQKLTRTTIPKRNALSCRQMQSNGGDDDECGDQVDFVGFVRATESI